MILRINVRMNLLVTCFSHNNTVIGGTIVKKSQYLHWDISVWVVIAILTDSRAEGQVGEGCSFTFLSKGTSVEKS